MLFTVYLKSTGQVLYSGECSDPAPLENENQALLLGQKIEKAGWVDSGEFILQPEAPSSYYVFDWVKKQWIDPRTPETQWPLVRAERNQRLQSSDWTQLADIPQETKDRWEPYRQALRDVTDQSDPFNIVWPTPPQ
jgi:hypothetical protein